MSNFENYLILKFHQNQTIFGREIDKKHPPKRARHGYGNGMWNSWKFWLDNHKYYTSETYHDDTFIQELFLKLKSATSRDLKGHLFPMKTIKERNPYTHSIFTLLLTKQIIEKVNHWE